MGDACGIGPEIIAQAFRRSGARPGCVVVGDVGVMRRAAARARAARCAVAVVDSRGAALGCPAALPAGAGSRRTCRPTWPTLPLGRVDAARRRRGGGAASRQRCALVRGGDAAAHRHRADPQGGAGGGRRRLSRATPRCCRRWQRAAGRRRGAHDAGQRRAARRAGDDPRVAARGDRRGSSVDAVLRDRCASPQLPRGGSARRRRASRWPD